MRISDWSSDVCSSDLDRPFLLERDEGVPAADFDVVKGGFDDRAIVEDRADLPDDFLALLQRRTGRQFIFDLAVVAVDRRLELLRQDHEQDDARSKGEEADDDDPDAMNEQQRSQEHMLELQSLMR